jgi:DNA-binding NarL/FixJ family response regulator
VVVRVVVVDDNDLLRAGLVTVLGSDPGLEVVGEPPAGPTASPWPAGPAPTWC